VIVNLVPEFLAVLAASPQTRTDAYHEYLERHRAVARAETFRVRNMRVQVATLEDLVLLKLEAAEEPQRRPSKRLSDLRDVLALLEEHLELDARIPDARRRVAQASLVATRTRKRRS